MKAKPKMHSQKVWQSTHSSSWYYESLWTLRGRKIKIYIRRNAYDFQNEARVSILVETKDQWNPLTSLPRTELKCNKISYVDRDVTASAFAEDEAELLTQADFLLS